MPVALLPRLVASSPPAARLIKKSSWFSLAKLCVTCRRTFTSMGPPSCKERAMAEPELEEDSQEHPRMLWVETTHVPLGGPRKKLNTATVLIVRHAGIQAVGCCAHLGDVSLLLVTAAALHLVVCKAVCGRTRMHVCRVPRGRWVCGPAVALHPIQYLESWMSHLPG